MNDATAGAETILRVNYTLDFSVWPRNGTLELELPAGFDARNATLASTDGFNFSPVPTAGPSAAVMLARATLHGANPWARATTLTFTVDADAPQWADVSFVVAGVRAPPYAGATPEFNVTVHNATGARVDRRAAAGLWLVPGAFDARPEVMLDALVAGARANATLNVTLGNPLREDGALQVGCALFRQALSRG